MKTDIEDIVGQVLDYERFKSGEIFQGLEIKPLTSRLIHCLLLDLPLSPPLAMDFGVTSSNHYRALKDALSCDLLEGDANHEHQNESADEAVSCKALQIRIVELDAAYGNAAKLNAFIKKNAPEYVHKVHFEPTAWDSLYGRDRS